MKKVIAFYLVCSFLLIYCACNNSPTGKKTDSDSMMNDSSRDHATTDSATNALADSGGDTLLFIGKFAQWKQPGTFPTYYDGLYDIQQKIFKVCVSHKLFSVPDSEVQIKTGANCDTAKKDQICFVLFKHSNGNGDSLRVLDNDYKIVVDPVTKKADGFIYTGDKAAKLPLKEKDYNRLIKSDIPIKPLERRQHFDIVK